MSAAFNYYNSNNVWTYASVLPATKIVNTAPKYSTPAPAPKPKATSTKPVVVHVSTKPVVVQVSSKPATVKVPVKPAPIQAPAKAFKPSSVPPAKNVRFVEPVDIKKLPQLPPIDNSCYAPPKVPPGVTRKIQINLPTEYRQVNTQVTPDLKVIYKEKNTHQTFHRTVVTQEPPRPKANPLNYQPKIVQSKPTQKPAAVYQMKSADYSKYFSF